jgi:RNA recognition motif-containing protein
MTSKLRPVFCGNFKYDARQPEIEKIFVKYGKVDRVDMKTGTLLLYVQTMTYVRRTNELYIVGFLLTWEKLWSIVMV